MFGQICDYEFQTFLFGLENLKSYKFLFPLLGPSAAN